MASPIGISGTVMVKTDAKGSSISIAISERAGVTAENLSLTTWGASYILANELYHLNPHSSKDDHSPPAAANTVPSDGAEDPKRLQPWILELGAGTGLVGLAAAALWGADVTLTDLPSIVPALNDNITVNSTVLKQNWGSASSGSLDWTEPTHLHIVSHPGESHAEALNPTTSQPSVILAADVIYSEEHPELLSMTIVTWLARSSKARAIICYPLRMAYIDHIRDFWELMEAAGLECVEEGRAEGDEIWNEVAHTPYEWCVWRWKNA